ncbi:MAG TPA: hypothetical protein VGM63_23385 [Mucilaginibacter sp.]|jgi:hypothetical protein
MEIDFNNLTEHTTSIGNFSLNWRFTDKNYCILPDEDLAQLRPLSTKAANFLWDYIKNANLHDDEPFTKGLFDYIDEIDISDDNKAAVREWLYQRGFLSDKKVYLSWLPTVGMIVPWEILIKYFNEFYYSSSDDLTVIDQSLNWALLFHHEDKIYFGASENYVLNSTFEDIDLI